MGKFAAHEINGSQPLRASVSDISPSHGTGSNLGRSSEAMLMSVRFSLAAADQKQKEFVGSANRVEFNACRDQNDDVGCIPSCYWI